MSKQIDEIEKAIDSAFAHGIELGAARVLKNKKERIENWSKVKAEMLAVLRESFPEPAPAEQGEGLLKQASNKLANAISDQDWGEAASASNDLDEYLASRPQPEAAKVVPMAMLDDISGWAMDDSDQGALREIFSRYGYTVVEK